LVIADARKRIADLQFSIKVFEQRKAIGETWPGSQTVNDESEQQHSV
jgi:hypothetical protein